MRTDNVELVIDGITNAVGEEDLTLYYEGINRVYVGKWGYITHCADQNIDESTGEITVSLTPGIFDDFTFDNEWVVTGSATTGVWERGIPIGGNGSANPEFDAEFDCSDYAFVTGNKNTFDADEDDVDNGNTRLLSPVFDLTSYADPYINYSRYFYNFFGPNGDPDDKLRILIQNASGTELIDEVISDPAIFYKWINKSIRVADFITPSDDMRVLIITSDFNPNFNITEAGFDYFHITEGSSASIEEESKANLGVYPNPVVDQMTLTGLNKGEWFEVYTTDGRQVLMNQAKEEFFTVSTSTWAPGVYFLRQGDRTLKIVK